MLYGYIFKQMWFDFWVWPMRSEHIDQIYDSRMLFQIPDVIDSQHHLYSWISIHLTRGDVPLAAGWFKKDAMDPAAWTTHGVPQLCLLVNKPWTRWICLCHRPNSSTWVMLTNLSYQLWRTIFYSLVILHNGGKSHFFMGKSTINGHVP